MLNGYDISNNQGDINNALVPGDFVWIKATEGVGYTDPNCDANYQQSRAAGKKLAVYHFARPDGNSPEAEAVWFVGQIQGYLGEAVLGLDSETEPVTPDWVKRFSDKVYELTKVNVVEYLDQDRLTRMDWSPVWDKYPVWVASYGANSHQNGYGDPNPPVTIPGNWNIFAVQYTSKGSLPSWSGELDLDIAYVNADGWKRQAQGDRNTPAPQPTPTPAPAPVVAAPEPAPVAVIVPPVVTEAPAPDLIVTTPAPEVEPPTTPITVISGPVVIKKNVIQKLIEFLKSNPVIVKAFHTAWQSFATVFIIGLTPVYTLITGGHIKEAALALLALTVAAGAAAFSAVKTYIVSKRTEIATAAIESVITK